MIINFVICYCYLLWISTQFLKVVAVYSIEVYVVILY